jgi:predicted TIM-barrel fold metal-dependent hydrolase
MREMIIDFHAHIWADQTDSDVDDFIRAMDARGIDKAVVHAIAPHVSNDSLAGHVRRHPDRLIGFASVMPFAETSGIPRTDAIVELERAVGDLGLRGLKLHPTIQGFSMDDPGLAPIVSKAGELGVPVLFHTGPSRGRAARVKNSMIEHIDDLAIMCPGTVIVAGHCDMLNYGPAIVVKHPRVYMDTTITWSRLCALIPGLGENVVSEVGSEKILFGTDANPTRLDRLSSGLDVLQKLNISDAERSNILGRNAASLLGLQQ